jgi:hypothetical protein
MAFSLVLESSSCLLGVPFGSRAFLAMRQMMPCMILGEVASWCLYFVAKPSHMGGGGRCGWASLSPTPAYSS